MDIQVAITVLNYAHEACRILHYSDILHDKGSIEVELAAAPSQGQNFLFIIFDFKHTKQNTLHHGLVSPEAKLPSSG